ncbi:hypothetical protein GCM10012280_68930 [Wenjunlia tyrosinilytica]|uniref:Uncharacterized protein n=1 Tax=Wenjunlia tyrosinilytica TaxID=1544741 RepID=A0A917ZZN2_9ACTN|nr:hypothetical protein GCM10012280_68930 [Wenjunlia tyrosinilytica]
MSVVLAENGHWVGVLAAVGVAVLAPLGQLIIREWFWLREQHHSRRDWRWAIKNLSAEEAERLLALRNDTREQLVRSRVAADGGHVPDRSLRRQDFQDARPTPASPEPHGSDT